MRLALWIVLMFAAGPAAAADTSADSLARILDTYVTQTTRDGFKGAVLIAIDGKVVLQKAFEVPQGPDGREPTFWIASNSKQFAAAAILKLQDEGKLLVRDSITRFIRGVPADKRGITIHHLLTHTAGLGTHYAADGLLDRDQAVRALLRAKLEWPVGAAHHYSNDGYNLLAVIVEVASGEPYERWLGAR